MYIVLINNVFINIIYVCCNYLINRVIDNSTQTLREALWLGFLKFF